MSELTTGDKKIWRRKEISLADWLDTFKEDLIKDFLNYHDDFFEGDFKKCMLVQLTTPYNPPVYRNAKATPYAWKANSVKYTDPFATPENKKHELTPALLNQEYKNAFPTAIRLTELLGDDCAISTYSIIEANSVIDRHTGPENRNADYIRIHVPLIVPEGDVFFEVAGEEIDWSDTFGFDNQRTHSAHNYTSKRRLVYLIDISRKKLGILPGIPWSLEKEMQEAAIPFVRIPKQ